MLFPPRWDVEITFPPAAANIQHLQRGAMDLSHLDAGGDRGEFKQPWNMSAAVPAGQQPRKMASTRRGAAGQWLSRYTQSTRAKANGKL